MIIKQEKRTIETSEDMETIKFKIETNDNKMFHLLSNLYSNPLGSTIREISTNCVDAHQLNNNENRPFHITLSDNTTTDTFISFRDFGPGMSHEDIKSIFCTFGKSTKSNSNDAVGCLGLGSKSPLSITDSFSVISINNNLKTIYTVSQGANGIPQLSVFGELKTDEENGVEIKIPLERKYISRVKDEITNQLFFFDTKPLFFIGNKEKNLTWFNSNSKDNLYGLTDEVYAKSKKNASHNTNCIIQGGISYVFDKTTFIETLKPIDKHRMNNKRFDPKTMEVCADDYSIIKYFLNTHMLSIFAKMGTVSFMPSRETLIYDSNTIEYIYNCLLDAIDKFKEKYDNTIKVLDNNWDIELVIHRDQFRLLNSELSKDNSKFLNRINCHLIKKFESYTLTPDILTSTFKSILTDNVKNLSNKLTDIRVIKYNSYENKYSDKYIAKYQKNIDYVDWKHSDLFDMCSTLAKNIKIIFTSSDDKFERKNILTYILDTDKYPDIILIRLKDKLSAEQQLDIVTKIGLPSTSLLYFDKIKERASEIIEQNKQDAKLRKKENPSNKKNKEKEYQVTNNLIIHTNNRKTQKIAINDMRGIKIKTIRNVIKEPLDILDDDFKELNNVIYQQNIINYIKKMLNIKNDDLCFNYLNEKDYNSKKSDHLQTLQQFYTESFNKIKQTIKGNSYTLIYGNSYDFYKIENIIKSFDSDKWGNPKLADKFEDLFLDKSNKLIEYYNVIKNNDNNKELFNGLNLSNQSNIETIEKLFDISLKVYKKNDISKDFFRITNTDFNLSYNKMENVIVRLNALYYISQHSPEILEYHKKDDKQDDEKKVA